MRIISDHLKSSNKNERSCSKELLENATNCNVKEDKNAYDDYNKWISENEPYLYFTGDGYNAERMPHFCKIDAESKYLCKTASPAYINMNSSLRQPENKNLKEFKKLDEKTRIKLGNISKKLHDYDEALWEKWMNQSIFKQIELADSVREV